MDVASDRRTVYEAGQLQMVLVTSGGREPSHFLRAKRGRLTLGPGSRTDLFSPPPSGKLSFFKSGGEFGGFGIWKERFQQAGKPEKAWGEAK